MNHLPAEDSHEMSSLICILKAGTEFENTVCCKFVGGGGGGGRFALSVNGAQ